MPDFWDISPPIDSLSAVFPGDTRSTQTAHFSIGPDCPVNVSRITLSPLSAAFDAHQPLLRHGMRVLLNLVPDAVPERDYEPIALPVKLMQADVGPVRAVQRALH